MALSSITKKLIMSISGLFLIIFLLLHMTINVFSVIDTFTGSYGAADGLFAKGCEFMALPIVTIMVPVLALGFLVHIVYAMILTAGNIKARGGYSRYASGSKGKAESWASKNMLVLGIIVLGLLAFHLNHFWAKMQLQEFMGVHRMVRCPRIPPYTWFLERFPDNRNEQPDLGEETLHHRLRVRSYHRPRICSCCSKRIPSGKRPDLLLLLTL